MENRYLYRGKRIDNGEWVQGSLVQTVAGSYIVVPYKHETILGEGSVIEIDTSTICQCTGLKDKNGNLIWENDIMVAHLDKDNPEDITYAIAAWSENGWATIENDSDDLNPIDDFTTENFEVVSTRFDNKKLLESEE